MKKCRLFFVIGTMMAWCHTYAQDCRQLCIEADKLFQAGKYEKAKEKYLQVISCENKNYIKDCKSKIALIDGLTYKPQKTVPFDISNNEVEIPYQGGERVVTVNGNSNWTVTINSDWCTIKKGKNNIIITSAENKGLEDRTATVVVKSGNQRKTVMVKNEGAPEMLRSSAEQVTFPSEGETNVVDIYANTNWNISGVPSWLSAKREGEKVRLTALANEQSVERTANIKIETPSNATIIINILQGAGKEHLSFSKNNLHFGPDGGDEIVKIYTDAEDWKFADFPHWCQVSKEGEDMLRIHCVANDPVDLNREGSVNITTGNQTLGINVSQDRKPAVAMIPVGGIGGRAISFGINAGYVVPMISTSASGGYKGSVVNYGFGNQSEEASYSSSGGFTIGAFADIRVYKNLYLIAGLNYTQYSYKNEFTSDTDRDITAAVPDYYFRGKIQDNYTEKYTMSFLEIPVLASYRLPVTRTSHVQFNVGPVFSFGMSAKMKLSGFSDGERIIAYSIVNNQKTNIVKDDVIPYPHHIKAEGEFDLYGKNVTYSETYVERGNAVVNKSQSFEASPFARFNVGARIGVAYEYKGINFGVEYNLMLTNMANKRYWEGNRWMIFDQTSPVLMSGYKQRNHNLQIKVGYTFRYL